MVGVEAKAMVAVLVLLDNVPRDAGKSYLRQIFQAIEQLQT